MTDLLLDTNAVSAAMKRDADLDEYLERLESRTQLFTSVVVEGEIRFGLARLPESRRKRELVTRFEAVAGSLHGVLEATRELAADYGNLKALMSESGTMIGDNDLWIAATGRVHGLKILTADLDLVRVPDLRVESWKSA